MMSKERVDKRRDLPSLCAASRGLAQWMSYCRFWFTEIPVTGESWSKGEYSCTLILWNECCFGRIFLIQSAFLHFRWMAAPLLRFLKHAKFWEDGNEPLGLVWCRSERKNLLAESREVCRATGKTQFLTEVWETHFWFPLQSHPPGQNTKGHNWAHFMRKYFINSAPSELFHISSPCSKLIYVAQYI